MRQGVNGCRRCTVDRGSGVASDPAQVAKSIRFGDDFELNPRAHQLRRAGRPLKLERIPMEILLLLTERRGQLVSREEIVERIWGKGSLPG